MKWKFFLALFLLPALFSCEEQENPKYIGTKYGAFDLDRVTFSENADSLLSRTEQYYRLPHEDGYFDEQQKKFVATDTLYHIYRVLPRYVAAGMFSFNTLELPERQVVDFYIDSSGNFRKIKFSVYMSIAAYKKLAGTGQRFKDITPAQVRKFNNDKYQILQHADGRKQTTLYALDNSKGDGAGSGDDYFVTISILSLKIKGDKFYEQENDDVK